MIDLKNNIKMVIWDLDETLWSGTISEGEIDFPNKNKDIIRTLVNRGIMCSICSKNNYDDIKSLLKKEQIWDYFVFPSISWESKGARIKEIIENAYLRADNILFIDDNLSNLKEAQFYCPKINIATPDILKNILELDELKGKDDKNHERLKQYKILEKKQAARKTSVSNDKFLKQSKIKISIEKPTNIMLDRIYEMIIRTNQLNFTKQRIDKNSLEKIIQNSKYNSGVVYAKDKYGYYGLIGFYALNNETNTLEHFLFSCRIMNLGIEQYIYARLNFPKINIIEPVSGKINETQKPSWIKEVKKLKNRTSKQKTDLLLLGGCDIENTVHYLSKYNLKFDGPLFLGKNNYQIRHDGLYNYRYSRELNNETKNKIVSLYPFLSPEYYDSIIMSKQYKIVVLSLILDMAFYFYRNINNDVVIQALMEFYIDVFKEPAEKIIEAAEKRNVTCFTKENIKRYQEEPVECSSINPDTLRKNLRFLMENEKDKQFILLNIHNLKYDYDTDDSMKRWAQLNQAIDDVAKEYDNCHLVDLRKIVKKKDDMTDLKTHYKRRIYKKISNEILKNIVKIKLKNFAKNISSGIKNLFG